jgi:ferredoxin
MAQANEFNPKKARIKVHMVGIPEVPVPVFSRHCDACGGKPVCLKYCPVGCITFAEGNPKVDQKNIVIAEDVANAWIAAVTENNREQ